MSTAESHQAGLEFIIADDGSIRAEDLARFGLRPGMHLRLLPATDGVFPRRITRGILRDKIPPEVVEEITQELWRNKEERIAAIMREDDE